MDRKKSQSSLSQILDDMGRFVGLAYILAQDGFAHYVIPGIAYQYTTVGRIQFRFHDT